MSECGIGITQLVRRVRIAVECKQAPRRQRLRCERVVEILTSRVAVDLDRDAMLCGFDKYLVPPRHDTGSRSSDPATRMGEHVHMRCANGHDQTTGLVVALP